MHHSQSGRIHTYIFYGDVAQIQNQLATLNPLLMDAIPLTLEEIFIYELGGVDYAVRNVVL